eukprot:1298181-Rhodomonas_salina.1
MHSVKPSSSVYEPVGQSTQGYDPDTALNLPGTHASHATAPAGPTSPNPRSQMQSTLPGAATAFAGHSRHTVAAAPLANVAPEHGEHSPAPGMSLNVPGLQGEHGEPSAPSCPAMQVHTWRSVLPFEELVPAGHAEHTEAPTSLWYVPSPHRLQGPDPFAALKKPA